MAFAEDEEFQFPKGNSGYFHDMPGMMSEWADLTFQFPKGNSGYFHLGGQEAYRVVYL